MKKNYKSLVYNSRYFIFKIIITSLILLDYIYMINPITFSKPIIFYSYSMSEITNFSLFIELHKICALGAIICGVYSIVYDIFTYLKINNNKISNIYVSIKVKSLIFFILFFHETKFLKLLSDIQSNLLEVFFIGFWIMIVVIFITDFTDFIRGAVLHEKFKHQTN